MAQLSNVQQVIQTENDARAKIMAADVKLMNDLNTFNLKYNKYINCNNAGAIISPTCGPNDVNCCTDNDKNLKTISDLQTVINGDLDSINRLINAYKGPIINPTLYDSNHNKIRNTEKDINQLRTELDQKLRDVYKINNTILKESISQNDSAIYTGILFTVLVTSVLYFTFTEL
jgi:glutathionyl-hydroquinone reductase